MVMESEPPKRLSHKEWRRQVKKARRKRLRREAARNHLKEIEELEKKLKSTEEYRQWIEEKTRLQEEQSKREELEHAVKERAWLDAEKKAQEEWQVIQKRKARAKKELLEQEQLIRQSFEMSSRRRRDERDERDDRRDERDDRRDERDDRRDERDDKRDDRRERRDDRRDSRERDFKRYRKEEDKMSEKLKKEFDDYIDNGAVTPEPLRMFNETQPRKEICPFFAKTGACRYGDVCSRNHQKPQLSTKICVPGFYTHFSLERHRGEYDTDNRLEYESRETRNHFRDFYTDVVPELEKFGKIRTLQYCKNTEPHLRGNLYVEYETERDAARAMRGLRGRWYAGRQLNCYFVNFKSWRGAVCGMVRCPKGSACNFLHVFRNPKSDYDIKSPPLWAQRQDMYERPDGPDRSDRRNRNRNNWDDNERRNWKWSESPPPRDRRRGDRYRFNSPPRGRGRFDNRRMSSRGGRRNFGENRFRNDRNFNGRRRRFSDSGSEGGRRSKSRERSRSPRRFSPSGSEERRSPSRSRSRSRTRSRSFSGPPPRPNRNNKLPMSRSTSRERVMRRHSPSPGRNYSERRERSMSGSPPGKPEDYEVISKISDAENVSGGSDRSPAERKRRPPSNWGEKYKPRRNTNDFHDNVPDKRQYHREDRQMQHQPSDPRLKGADYEWDTTDSDN